MFRIQYALSGPPTSIDERFSVASEVSRGTSTPASPRKPGRGSAAFSESRRLWAVSGEGAAGGLFLWLTKGCTAPIV
jgi:hypothetical protein